MKIPASKRSVPGQPPHANPGRKAKGLALIEALVASSVLTVGLTAATRLTLHTLYIASDTRQHTVALALALDAMDCQQSGRPGCALQASTTVQGTTYKLQSQLHTRPGLALQDLQVSVQWPSVGPALGVMGVSLGGGSVAAPPGQDQPHIAELILHSSRDAVPSWVGVSSP